LDGQRISGINNKVVVTTLQDSMYYTTSGTVCQVSRNSATSKNYSAAPLADAVADLEYKFRNSYKWHFKWNGEDLKKHPVSIRGNSTYAYYQNIRLEAIQKLLNNRIDIKPEISTNALFITLTNQYDTHDQTSIEQTWPDMKKALPKFKARLRKLGMSEFVNTIESHESGGAHGHLVVIFSEQIPMFASTEWDGKKQQRVIRWRIKDAKLREAIKLAWAKARKGTLDNSFVDITACHNTDIAGYITKELGKASSCEAALKRLKSNTYSQDENGRKQRANDKKKIFLHYYSDKYRLRMLYVSKGLSTTEPDEETEPPTEPLQDNSAYYNINQVAPPPMTMTITRHELLLYIKFKEISPYSGRVEPETPEYKAVLSILMKEWKRRTEEAQERKQQKTFQHGHPPNTDGGAG
jgi:hypothetical protein